MKLHSAHLSTEWKLESGVTPSVGHSGGGREPGSLQGSWDRYCLSGEQRASAGPVSRVTPLSPTPSSTSPWYVARRHAVLKRNVTRRSPGIVCGRASRATRAAMPGGTASQSEEWDMHVDCRDLWNRLHSNSGVHVSS